jgi:hypothetical protein
MIRSTCECPAGNFAVDLQQIARALGGEIAGDQVRAPDPHHSAKDRSLSIRLSPDAPDGFLCHSFANDDPIECKDFVRQKLGLAPFQPNGDRPRRSKDYIAQRLNAAIYNPAPRSPKIVASYDYVDQDRTLLYQNCRFEPKDFRQRRPDGNGAWIWKL